MTDEPPAGKPAGGRWLTRWLLVLALLAFGAFIELSQLRQRLSQRLGYPSERETERQREVERAHGRAVGVLAEALRHRRLQLGRYTEARERLRACQTERHREAERQREGGGVKRQRERERP